MPDVPKAVDEEVPPVAVPERGADESEPLDDAPVGPLTDEDDTKGG